MDPEVREFEPDEALFAPAQDVDHFAKALVAGAIRSLAPLGLLLVELGSDQAPRLRAWLATQPGTAEFHRDLAGHERVLVWRAEYPGA
ncbi:MAG: hypothetical protein R3E96_13315 [Planctomycetota bacterium]